MVKSYFLFRNAKSSGVLLLCATLSNCSSSSKKDNQSTTSTCTTSKTSAALRSDGGLYVFNGASVPSTTLPYVGSLFYSYNGVEGLCTGSLICPNVVISAAHCFYNAGPASNAANQNAPITDFYFSLSATAPFTGSASDIQNLPCDAIVAESVTIASGWNGSKSMTSSGPDMAIVKLAKNMIGPLASLNFTSVSNTTTGGTASTAVGYGQSVQNDGSAAGIYGAGTKRQGDVLYQGAASGDAGTLLTLRGSTGQDTCEGDSGGPLLINSKVSGTLSGGDSAGCGVAVGTVESGTKIKGVSYYSSVAYNATWIKAQMQSLCGSTTPTAATLSDDPAATNTIEENEPN